MKNKDNYVRDMIEAEEALLKMIMEENISSIYIMGSRLGETPEVINSIISELLQGGHVEGHFSEDGKRFFRTDAEVVDRPILAIEDEGPSFLRYNTRPGTYATVTGFIFIVIAIMLPIIAQGFFIQDLSMILIVLGMIILWLGAYQISRRRAP